MPQVDGDRLLLVSPAFSIDVQTSQFDECPWRNGEPVVGKTLVHLLNAGGDAVGFLLPAYEPGLTWTCLIDTCDETRERQPFAGGRTFRLGDHSVAVFLGVRD